jgi:hypothetical protein
MVHNRLSRFKANGDVALDGSEEIRPVFAKAMSGNAKLSITTANNMFS